MADGQVREEVWVRNLREIKKKKYLATSKKLPGKDNVTLTCQIGKTRAKIFKYGGRNGEWKETSPDTRQEIRGENYCN